MNRRELRAMPTSFLLSKYESKDDMLEYKLSEIEEAARACRRLADSYELSRKLFALLQEYAPSRQLTEGFERVRSVLYAKQEEIMKNIGQ